MEFFISAIIGYKINDRNLNRYKEFEDRYGVHDVFELPDGAIVRHHSREWIEELTSDFETKKIYDCELTSMNGNQSSCFQFIGKKQQIYTSEKHSIIKSYVNTSL